MIAGVGAFFILRILEEMWFSVRKKPVIDALFTIIFSPLKYWALIYVGYALASPYYPVEARTVGIILASLVFGHYLKRGLSDLLFTGFLEALGIPKRYLEMLRSTKGILDFVLYLIPLTIGLSVAGIDIQPLVVSFGIAGFAVSLAIQKPFADFLSGIFLVLDPKFAVGKKVYIKNAGMEGVVKEITWRRVILEAEDGKEILVPNSKVTDSVIVIS